MQINRDERDMSMSAKPTSVKVNNINMVQANKYARTSAYRGLLLAMLSGFIVAGLSPAAIAAGTHKSPHPAYSESAIQPMPEMPIINSYQRASKLSEEAEEIAAAAAGIDPIITGPVPTSVNVR